MRVLVVAGPGLVADARLLREVAGAEAAALGVPARFAVAGDAAALEAELGATSGDCAVVVLPGPHPDVRALMGLPAAYAPRTVWLDLERTGPVPVAGGAAHQQGRGVGGLIWAIRHAVHRLRWPARRIAYGPHPDQWAELRLPAPPARSPVPVTVPVVAPVVVLVHGGYWRSVWGADLMDALAVDLARRGLASWNLEYRRPDLHGWDATTADVAAGIAALRSMDVPVDLGRVAVAGHSAGGQLALRAAADAGGAIAVAVSLAGVLDLVEGHRRHMSSGAVAGALGGTPEELPEVYAAASPLGRLPLGVPHLVVQGASDDPDLVDMARRYAAAAGGEALYIERPGDHWSVIDPSAPICAHTARDLTARLASARG
ncbi:alpha/beta hydrolase [Sphaerisporangium album]|uniref:Alpha/beta hydrolase n=1 Tax=Sphaerisporangium album TaxID=509200 RepID=A0A367FA37_9ACTN|nr:prolyl oligopeptidase family serine peptidase [Sphaerisporangium album]RCG26547.1 alpha/beta hydrolase [Sphaerisporangium album]